MQEQKLHAGHENVYIRGPARGGGGGPRSLVGIFKSLVLTSVLSRVHVAVGN